MDTRSKILFFVAIVLIALSVLSTFYKTIVTEDFEVVYEEASEEDASEGTISDDESNLIENSPEEAGESIDSTGAETLLE
jgi:hypothetical protein